MQLSGEKPSKPSVGIKNIRKQDLDRIVFFVFSEKIPAPTLLKYNKLANDFIQQKRLSTEASDNLNKIYNQFVFHLTLSHEEFFFTKLRPYIIVSFHEQFVYRFRGKNGYVSCMLQQIQPSLFVNLEKLVLDNQYLVSLEWIKFLDLAKLQNLSLKHNNITILKPLSKCQFSSLSSINILLNRFTRDDISNLYRARFLQKDLIELNQVRIKSYSLHADLSGDEGIKFEEYCQFDTYHLYDAFYVNPKKQQVMMRKLYSDE